MRDRNQDTAKVKSTPSTAIATTDSADTAPAMCAGTRPPMKIEATRIWVGQRPLQSEKLFVMIAIRRSRGLSMIRVEMIAAALQPQPMAIVSDCLP